MAGQPLPGPRGVGPGEEGDYAGTVERGEGDMVQTWSARCTVVVVALALLVASGTGPAMGGKPGQPPPSGKSIYYKAGTVACRMASDGSGKTTLAGSLGYRMTDTTYGGAYWWVTYKPCTVSEPRTPEGYSRNKIVVGPVNASEPAPFEILNDAYVNPWCTTFRPGGENPCVTFVAVVWDENGENPTAGLYQIEFAADGTYIGDPELLLTCETFSDWSDPTYTETAAQMTWHDWFDSTTIVYGDDAFAGYGTVPGLWAQLYYGNIEDDPANHVALIASGGTGMHYGVQFNSTGSKVLYQSPYGNVYEVATTGNSAPVAWVTAGSSTMAGGADYLSDDTIVYEWYDARKRTQDLCSKKWGSAGKNLTGDTSDFCSLFGTR